MLACIVLAIALSCIGYACSWWSLPTERRRSGMRGHVLLFLLAGGCVTSVSVLAVAKLNQTHEAAEASKTLYALEMADTFMKGGVDCDRFADRVNVAESEAKIFHRYYPESTLGPKIDRALAPYAAAKRAWQYSLNMKSAADPKPYAVEWIEVVRGLNECGVPHKGNRRSLYPGTLARLTMLGSERLPALRTDLGL